jgi:hypothetical protein
MNVEHLFERALAKENEAFRENSPQCQFFHHESPVTDLGFDHAAVVGSR